MTEQEYSLVNGPDRMFSHVENLKLPWKGVRRFIDVLSDGRCRVFDHLEMPVRPPCPTLAYVGTYRSEP